MKTDKELLELAAKAAGLKCKWFKVKQWAINDRCKIRTGSIVVFGTHHTKPWNPLTDDGDALRLAVKLRMPISHISASVLAQAYYDDMPSNIQIVNVEEGREAATRRAIVKAAAAIGEKL